MTLPGMRSFEGLMVREGAADEVPMAVFSETLPTEREVARVLRYGMGIHIAGIPPQQRKVDLRGLLQGVTHLGIVSTIEDVEWVADMAELEVLSLYCSPANPVDLSRLTKLRRFDGFLRNLETVLQLPSLVKLSLQEVRDGVIGTVGAPLEECELVDMQNLTAVPHFARANQLKKLSLVGSRTLNIGDFGRFRELNALSIVECAELKGVAALRELRKLETLDLEACRSIEHLEELLALTGMEIRVHRRNPFDSNFRRAAHLSGAQWTFLGPMPR